MRLTRNLSNTKIIQGNYHKISSTGQPIMNNMTKITPIAFIAPFGPRWNKTKHSRTKNNTVTSCILQQQSFGQQIFKILIFMYPFMAVKIKLYIGRTTFTYPFPMFLADILPFYKLPFVAAPQLFTAWNDGYSTESQAYITLQWTTES